MFQSHNFSQAQQRNLSATHRLWQIMSA
jgi:hypothetical protein